MDIKYIFIIIGIGWSKERVVKELEEEKYKDKFAFNVDNDYSNLSHLVEYASEIWVFGDACTLSEYKYAKKIGQDIWMMG